MTFDQWREYSLKLHARADKVRAMMLERARKTAGAAGLDSTMPFLHAHNARCSFDYGKPWPGVNYSLVRRVQWLERKMWEPSRLVEKLIDRAWRQQIAADRRR